MSAAGSLQADQPQALCQVHKHTLLPEKLKRNGELAHQETAGGAAGVVHFYSACQQMGRICTNYRGNQRYWSSERPYLRILSRKVLRLIPR